MALPFILAGAALLAGGYGVKKGYDGYQDQSLAEDISKGAKKYYDGYKQTFDLVNKATQNSLEQLGDFQLQIGTEFSEFKKIADSLLAKINKASNGKKLEVTVPKHQLDKIAELSLSTTTYLAQVATAGVAGAGAAYAVYGGVMAFAAASTGTPIAALSGAAAYNATLAAIGGGSISAGGFGMAGGTMVLGSVVVAPIIAIAGWAYAHHAEKALSEAKDYERKVNKAVYKIELANNQLVKINKFVKRIHVVTNNIHDEFLAYFNDLKTMEIFINSGRTIPDDEILLRLINNGYSLAAILTDIITTPLFKAKKDHNGHALMVNGTVELESDSNGLQVLNKDEMNKKLIDSTESYKKFKH